MNNFSQETKSEILCSTVSSFVKSCMIQPFDFLRIRLQTCSSKRVNLYRLITAFKKDEGISVFLKGYTPTFIGSILASIFHLTLYQKFKFLLKFNLFKEESIYETQSLDFYKIRMRLLEDLNEEKMDSLNFKMSLILKLSSLAGIAGFFSGTLLSIVTTPIDNIRIRLQSMQNLQINTKKGHEYVYTSPRECIWSVFRHKGIKGFFVAFPICIFRESYGSLVYFSMYEYLKNCYQLLYNKEELPFHITFMIGGFSGMTNWIITLPIDCIKTKLISDSMRMDRKYSGFRDCVVYTYNEFGLKGFYSGLSVMLVRAFVANGSMFSTFEACRYALKV